MSKAVAAGVAWAGLYVALALFPLAVVLAGTDRPGRGFWTEFSVGLGFVGLAMMGLQFVLTARFQRLKAPYGSDIVYHFHRQISLLSVGLILLHPGILLFVNTEDMLRRLNPVTAPWPARLGVASVLCLLGLVAVSLWRRRLGIAYDWWRRTHAALGVCAAGLAMGHAWMIGHYLNTPVKRGLWLAYTLAWVGLIVWVRLIKPLTEIARPYEVESVTPQRGGAWSLAVRPVGHAGLRFQPGQFAWITLFHSPLSDREHPFSFSGSAEAGGRLEFTIKQLGDFTARIRDARPGDRVYVDGPFGSLTMDRRPGARGLVFIAGGVGITPMISHLRTMADRADARPAWLVYANRDWESATFREEIDALRERLPNLRVTHVLSQPHDGWDGQRGFVTEETLRRALPADVEGLEFFVCGPDPMMESVERSLRRMGAPMWRVHAERFNLV